MARSPAAARTERGAAAIEFALVANLLLLLVMGIISYGYMLSFRQGLSQGAAEGARAAAVLATAVTAPQKSAAAKAAVSEALSSYGVSCDGVNLKNGTTSVGTCTTSVATCANDATAQCATVTVDYLYRDNPLVPTFPGLGLLVPEHLRYSAVAKVSP